MKLIINAKIEFKCVPHPYGTGVYPAKQLDTTKSKMNSSKMSITKTKTPFLFACKYGTIEDVRILLADPVINPAEGNSMALFIAVEQMSSTLLKLLLEDGRADPMVAEGVLFSKAITTGDEKLVCALMEDPRIVIPNDISLLIASVAYNYHREYAVFERLLVYIDPSGDDNAVLFTAISHGNDDAFATLLQDPRVNPAHNDNAALRYAIETGNDRALHILLSDPRVVPSADDNALLKIATKHAHMCNWSSLLYENRMRCLGRLLMEPRVIAGTLPKIPGGIEGAKKMQADAHAFYTRFGWTAPMPEIVERDA